MKNNKLLTLLTTFSTSDLYHFRKYICSPFFNENQELVLLFDHLKEMDFLKNRTDDGEEKLGIWSHLFPRKKFDDTRFRRLFSDLLQLAFDFLSHQRFKKNPALDKVFLLNSLSRPELKKHFAGTVRLIQKELDESLHDADFYYTSYLFQKRQHEWQENIPRKKLDFSFIKQADHHLDCYYMCKKLEHYCDTLNYQDIFESATKINLPPQFFEYLNQPDFQNELVVKAWHLVVLMNRHPDQEEYFFQLKTMLEEKDKAFKKTMLKSLFIHLMNYCMTTKAHRGRHEYWGIVLSLYKTALTKKIILEKSTLGFGHYKNIVAIALHLKEFDWVESFIQTYSQYLSDSDRENAISYNLAKVYFHQKKHMDVIEQLRSVEYKNVEYAIGSRWMLLQTYYELEEVTALDSLLDSFKIFIRRNTLITRDTKQRCLNIIRFTRKLTKLAPYDEKGRTKLYHQIETCKNVGIKPWLLEKCQPNRKTI